MDPIDREILVLRHYEQLSNGEAAQVLGLDKSAASKRYVRALVRLKEILAAACRGGLQEGADLMSDSSADRDPLEKLAESFLARFRAGERPSIEEYAAKYPELADQIRELLPALVDDRAGHVDRRRGDRPAARPRGRGTATPRQLGDYLILREIGRGGMGVVYEAVQQSLGRHVALKVLPLHGLGGSSHLERFRLEARAAARLHHTNIVPVFGVGEHEGDALLRDAVHPGAGPGRGRRGAAPAPRRQAAGSAGPAKRGAPKATLGAGCDRGADHGPGLLTGRLARDGVRIGLRTADRTAQTEASPATSAVAAPAARPASSAFLG